MATYSELYSLASDQTLISRVTVAIAIAAEAIRTETAGPDRDAKLVWVRSALYNPDGMARQMMWALLAQNATNTVAQIQGATDAQILAAVNAAVGIYSGV